MASLQRRYGPNINGVWGLLQPILDGLKLLLKEIIIPSRANPIIFLMAPAFAMSLSFSLFVVMPISFQTVEFHSKYSLLVLFTISSLNVYTIVLSGWASNSKYALLGSLRAIAQMISYELTLGTIFLIVLVTTSSLNFFDIVYYQMFNITLWQPLFPICLFAYVALLAETNRVPFDLPEAEAELVAGYNVEYSSIFFAMFFLSEYCSMVVMSCVWVILFFGGWSNPIVFSYFNFFLPGSFILALKSSLVWVLFIVTRALLPRYRFDQLLSLGWNILLPFSFSFFFFLLNWLHYWDAFLNIYPHYNFLPHSPVGKGFSNASNKIIHVNFRYKPFINDYFGNYSLIAYTHDWSFESDLFWRIFFIVPKSFAPFYNLDDYATFHRSSWEEVPSDKHNYHTWSGNWKRKKW